MAKIHARNTLVFLSDDGGTTWTDISAMCTSISVDDNTEATDVTSFGSDGYKEFITGFTEGSFSADGWYETALYADVLAARLSDNAKLRIRPTGTGTALPQIQCSVTGFQLSTNFDVSDASGCSFSGTVSGPIDYTAQA